MLANFAKAITLYRLTPSRLNKLSPVYGTEGYTFESCEVRLLKPCESWPYGFSFDIFNSPKCDDMSNFYVPLDIFYIFIYIFFMVGT